VAARIGPDGKIGKMGRDWCSQWEHDTDINRSKRVETGLTTAMDEASRCKQGSLTSMSPLRSLLGAYHMNDQRQTNLISG
jgi:hypothetical protein